MPVRQPRINPVFTWCKQCQYYFGCYKFDEETGDQTEGPNYMDPTCAEGPVQS